MSPYLLPILLIMFGEFSVDKMTRVTARVLLYGYLLSIFLFSRLPAGDDTILVAWCPYILSYVYLLFHNRNIKVRVLLSILTLLQIANCLSLYFNSYTVLLNIPFYLEYSNMILRELHVMSVLFCTDNMKVDNRLKVVTFATYVAEYLTLTIG